jgi:hypothetical protein
MRMNNSNIKDVAGLMFCRGQHDRNTQYQIK